jgi:hypothetical protein
MTADPGWHTRTTISVGEVVLDLLRQLCDHTLHLGGDFERVLEAIPRSPRPSETAGT